MRGGGHRELATVRAARRLGRASACSMLAAAAAAAAAALQVQAFVWAQGSG